MANLVLEEGALIQIESASLPVATFSKFQPLSEDFLDITNPKAGRVHKNLNFSLIFDSNFSIEMYYLCSIICILFIKI